MSISIMSQVFKMNMPELKTDQGVSVSDSSCKFVLLALADHANDEGYGAYPSVNRLQQKTNLSRQTVCNALNALRTNKFTELQGRSRRQTSNYRILVARLTEVYWLDYQESSGWTGDGLVARPESSLNIHKPSINPKKKSPSKNKKIKKAKQESPDTPTPVPPPPPPDERPRIQDYQYVHEWEDACTQYYAAHPELEDHRNS